MIATATITLFFSAHAVHASASARAPALEITLMSRVSLGPEPPCPKTATPLNATDRATHTNRRAMAAPFDKTCQLPRNQLPIPKSNVGLGNWALGIGSVRAL